MAVCIEDYGSMVSDMGMGEWNTRNQSLCILEGGSLVRERVMVCFITLKGNLVSVMPTHNYKCISSSSSSFSDEHYLGIWNSDKYHGPGIKIEAGSGDGSDSTLHCSIFHDGIKVGDGSSLMIERQWQDEKWAALFQWCTDLLQQMVTPNTVHIHYRHFQCGRCVIHYVGNH